uniref:Uncharacterized protein LOC102802712 n=1 Tax=Saccoglossus kowalevskii TaxID=10224 RepID=A0ABM0MA55_SACKO
AESPVVICPADIFQNTDDGASWANVTWGAVNATDNSGSVIDVYVYHAPGSNFPIGSTIVTYSAVDAYNNTGYCSFSVTIIDAESPVVICPADILQNTDDGASWANVTWGAVNATDNSGSVTNVYVSHAPSNAESPVVICQADILQNTDDGAPWANVTWGVVNATDNSGSVSDIYVSHAPDSNFPIGSTIVTYSAVDAYNNTGYCSFSVTVIDAESPVVICPADIFQNTEDGATWANVTWGVVNATDNSGSVTDLYVSHAPSSNFSIGSTQVTYSAVDAYNNTGHCSFIVTIINAESPVVICPADIFQNTDDGASWANVTWGAVNATDNSGSVIDVYVYHAPGSNFPIGSTIVTYSAVDAYNNTGYCSFSVTIIDAESPVVICPADILQNTDDGAPWANVTWGVVNATDNSGSVTDLYVSHAPSSNFPIGSTQVTYSAVDAYNNTGHCSFIVTIINAESPVVICPADIFQNTDDGASWANVTWGAVNATDNSGSVIDVYVYHAPGSNFPIGSTIVTYSAVDAYNNTGYCSFSVTIIDAESPVVICPADILQNTDDGASWANVTWGAVNATDNSGSVTNVYVSHAPSNAESPVVICPADILQNTDDGAPWANVTWGVVNATDNSGSVTDLYVSHAPSSNFPIGSTQVTYSAVDAYNNTGHCSFIVTIINAESPVVICPADIFQNTDDGASWANVTWGAVNATDNSGSVIDVYVYHAPGSNFPIGSTIVTYSAVDAYNNTGYCSFSVTIIDAESPVVICPADILQNTDDGASWANVTWGAVNATDNSGSVTNVYVSHAPSNAESPVVICPADILQNTDDGAPWANVTWGVVNATDNSGSVSDIYVSHAPDSNFPIGSTIVTYSAVDAYNNTGYCSFSVTVIDAESPVVICPADIFQNTDDGATWANVTWGVVNATDNSGSVTDLYVSHAPSSNFPIGSTQVTYSAVDAYNNTGHCSFIVTIINTESPVVICPADIFQNTDDGASWANVTWGAVNATDNSGSVIDVYVSHAPGSNFPIGSTIVTYSAVDAYNNTGYCSFSVTIIDAESPVVICPADILQNTDDGASWANVTWGAVNATDNSGSVTNVYVSHAPSNAESPVVICPADILQNTDDGAPWANVTWGVVNATDNSGSVSDIYVSHAPGSNFPVGSTIVTYSAVDAYNNTGYCSFSVTVIDAESPVVICPADIFQNTDDGATWANVTWGFVNATDNSGSVTDLYVSHAPSSNFPIGSTQVTYSAVDAYNNTGHCSFIVTIINAESPVVICPADIFQNTDDGASWANVTWGAVNATDNSGSVIDVYVYHAPGSNFPIGSTIVTYSAVDAYNNTGYCSFSVTIIDAESTVVICPADILQNTDDGAPWANVTWGVVNATDNSGSVSDIYVSHAPGSNFPIGSTIVTYSAVDAYNNMGYCSFSVTVIDAESPVVICPADIFQTTDDGATWANVTWGVVNATDNSGSVTDLYVSHAPSSNFPIGSTQVTYSAVDAYNNTGHCSFIVTIINAESPVVICPADIFQNTDDGASWANVTWGAVNATDNSGSVIDVYVYHAPGSNFPIGSTIVTYSAVDAYNNTGYCSFSVTIIDAESTVVICPADILQNTDDGAPWANVTWGVVNATDNSGSVSDIYVSHAPGSNFPIGSTIVTYSAVDAYNNMGYCSFSVTVIDAESPVVICPADIFQTTDDGATWANVTWGVVNATDNSGSVTDLYVSHAPSSNFPIGSTQVTYSAVDAYNNTGHCSFIVTIINAESPVVICPADIFQNTDDGASWANVTWGAVNATDNSGSVIDVYVYHAPGSNFPIGSTIVTYSAVDAYNNTGYCSFSVTIIDAESPVVICPADILQNTDDGASWANVTWGAVNATDNSGSVTNVYVSHAPSNAESPVVICPANILQNTDDVAPWANVTWGVVNATDNSGSVSDIYVSHARGSNFPTGSTIVTYSAVDAYNNTGYCSFSVTVIDAESPVVICPADIFQNTDDGATWANVTWGVVNATDNSGSVTDLYVSHAPSSNFPIGSTQVTYSAVDAYNNTGHCSFIVTIINAESPVVICPADILQNTDDGASWANVTWGAVNATDNSGSVTNVYVSHAPSSNFPIGSTIVTYSAVDAYNNTGYCSFSVTIIDAESPVVICPADIMQNTDDGASWANVTWGAVNATDNSGSVTNVYVSRAPSNAESTVVICPADILQNTDDGAPWANVTWGVVNATDNSGSVSDIYVSHAPGSNFPIGSTIVTYSAVDAYNNMGYCSFSVTVIDAESPVVICPADIFQTTDDGATWANVTWGVVNATDNSGSVTDLYVSHAPSSNFPIGSTQVTYSAVDAYNNTGHCSFIVTIINAESPVVICPADIFQNTDDGASWANVTWGAVNATDNSGSVIDVYVYHAPGSNFPIGSTIVTYSAVDAYNNTGYCSFSVTIIDAESPVVICPADILQNTDDGASWANVTWGAVNATDNSGSVTNVYVSHAPSNAESPVVICQADILQNTDDGAPWANVTWGVVNATDNSGSVSDIYVSHAPDSNFPIGSTIVTYSAVDAYNNTGYCSFSVNVIDAESPVVICPADIFQNTEDGATWANVTWGVVNATDNSGSVTDLYVSHAPSSNFSIGSTQVTYSAVDAYNNTGHCSFIVTIINAESPVVICPADIFQNTDDGASWANVTWGAVNATDNSGFVIDVYVSHAPGSNFYIGSTIVTYSAVDAYYNTGYCSFSVTIIDAESPVVICPADIMQNTDDGASWANVTWGAVNATDNSGSVTNVYVSRAPSSNFPIGNAESPVVICPADILQNTDDGAPWANVTWGVVNATDNSGSVSDIYVSHAPDSNFPIGSTIVTYSALDAYNNTGYCSFSVTVIDTESPVVICPADIFQNTDDGATWANVTWGVVNATDNSGSVTDLYVSHAPSSNFPIGSTQVTYSAVDAYNNTGHCSFIVTIINAESPVVICPADILQNTDDGASWANVTWGAVNATDNSGSVTNVYVSHAPSSNFPIGSTIVTYSAVDAYNNTGYCSFSVTIIDAESPVVICPADIMQNTDDGASWANVTWGAVNATDNSGSVTNVYVSRAPSNAESTVVICPADILQNTDDGAPWANVTWGVVNATDNSGSVSDIYVSHAPGSNFPIGSTIVTYSAVDAYNNMGYCSFSVTVIDAESPVVICPADIFQNTDDGASWANVTWGAVNATDNSGSVIDVYVYHAPGSNFPIGSTIVTYSAVDAYNNTGYCSFSVTII